MKIHLGQLAIFHAVALEGSFTKGGERLEISQPAVSKSLADFESSLGFALFNRAPRGVSLTPAGERLFGYAKQIFLLQDEAGRAMDDIRGIRSGQLIIACTELASHLVTEPLSEFLANFPEIEGKLLIERPEVVAQRVERGQVDVGFSEFESGISSVEAESIFQARWVPVVSAGHPLAQSPNLNLAKVKGQKFLVTENFKVNPALVGNHSLVALGDVSSVKRAVASGLGIAWLPSFTIADELGSGRFGALKFETEPPLQVFKLESVWRMPSPALKAFSGLIREWLR